MSLQEESLNFVFSNCVIEHIPNNAAVLKEVSRILKKGGFFMFTVPSHHFPDFLYLTNKFASWGLAFLSRFYKYRRNKMLNQFHCYDIDDWMVRLQANNFEVIQYKYLHDKKTLMLWDKLALEVFFKKIFSAKAEKKCLVKNYSNLAQIAEIDFVSGDQGAGLFILCKKIGDT